MMRTIKHSFRMRIRKAARLHEAQADRGELIDRSISSRLAGSYEAHLSAIGKRWILSFLGTGAAVSCLFRHHCAQSASLRCH
jgi:hypothetical protein